MSSSIGNISNCRYISGWDLTPIKTSAWFILTINTPAQLTEHWETCLPPLDRLVVSVIKLRLKWLLQTQSDRVRRVQTDPARHNICTLKGTSGLASVLAGSGPLLVFSHSYFVTVTIITLLQQSQSSLHNNNHNHYHYITTTPWIVSSVTRYPDILHHWAFQLWWSSTLSILCKLSM